MTSTLALSLLLLVGACGPSAAEQHYRSTTAGAESDAHRWAASLGPCPTELPGGAVRLEGTIEVSSGGVMTELFCDAPACCNTLTPESIALVQGDGSRVLLAASEGPGVPSVLAEQHDVLSCAWDPWRRAFRVTPVVVIGTEVEAPGAARWIRVLSVCAP